jgi:hypothetical protein
MEQVKSGSLTYSRRGRGGGKIGLDRVRNPGELRTDTALTSIGGWRRSLVDALRGDDEIDAAV